VMTGFLSFEQVRHLTARLAKHPEFRSLPLAQRHLIINFAARGELELTAAGIQAAIENLDEENA
jgi:hypothetical protein